MYRWVIWLILLLSLTTSLVKAEAVMITNTKTNQLRQSEQTSLHVISTLEKLFATPDNQIDFITAKLTIDKLIAPSFNAQQTLNKINKMVKTVRDAQTPDMTDMDKLMSLSAYLYESGVWNENQPFVYDLDDPLGQRISAKLLSTYLTTKRGNCISMPILYFVMAYKLNLKVSLSTGPLHVFVQHKDKQGKTYNIEATSNGSFARDDYYKAKSTITDEAMNNQVYLQYLTPKEVLALMAILLSEYYEQQGDGQLSIDVARLVLNYYPTYAYAMIKIGNGYQQLLQAKLAEVKARGSYSAEEKRYMDNAYQENLAWFAKADAIGWVMPSKQENSDYLKSIKQQINSLIKS